jgi:uncharacterized protein
MRAAGAGRRRDGAMGIIRDTSGILGVLQQARRVAVLGIKTEAQSSAPAYYVPAYLQRAGYAIVPVPVYYPDATEILGEPVYRRLVDVPGVLDLVVVFRRSRDVPAHLDDMLAARPRAVWFQLGIRNEAVVAALADTSIDVVQDRCTMIDHRRIL